MFSQAKSIWRGDIWSEVHFRVRLHSSITAHSKHRVTPLILVASIQLEKTGQMYGNENDGRVQIDFARTPFKDKSCTMVDSDPYHQVKLKLHNTMFDAQDSFVLRVDVDQIDQEKKADAFVFGCSQSVWICTLSFVIEQDFLKNQHVVQMDDDTYVWFGKCGNGNTGLDIKVSLKNEYGETALFSGLTPFIAELVYDDCSPAPEFALSAHKLRRASNPTRPTKLFNVLTPNPAIRPFQESGCFSFRIEEVSFHHPGHAGFRIKVSAVQDKHITIHPAVLNKLIIVLSKPKYDNESIATEELDSVKNAFRKRKSDSMELTSCNSREAAIPRQVSDSQKLTNSVVNLHHLASCFLLHGGCMCCKKPMQSSNEFYSVAMHELTCHVVTNLVPRISWYCPTNITRILTVDNLLDLHQEPTADQNAWASSCTYTEI